jgi:hypothetical protein
MIKFARCMREHGMNIPDPVAGQPLRFSTSNPQGMEAAQNACKRYRVAQEISPAERTAHLEAALKFARCMRRRGINVPDPTTSGGGVGIKVQGGPGGIDPSSPTFQAAQNACQSLLGKNLPSAGLQTSRVGPGGGGASLSSSPAPSGG